MDGLRDEKNGRMQGCMKCKAEREGESQVDEHGNE